MYTQVVHVSLCSVQRHAQLPEPRGLAQLHPRYITTVDGLALGGVAVRASHDPVGTAWKEVKERNTDQVI